MDRLGSVYNAATGFVWQERIEEWAKENHASLWDELSERGWKEDEMGIKQILGIDRSVRA